MYAMSSLPSSCLDGIYRRPMKLDSANTHPTGSLTHDWSHQPFHALACPLHHLSRSWMKGWKCSAQTAIPSRSTFQQRSDLITFLELRHHPEPNLESWNQSPWHVVFRLRKTKGNRLSSRRGQLLFLQRLPHLLFGEWRMRILFMDKNSSVWNSKQTQQ
jgi:hypothetical protein